MQFAFGIAGIDVAHLNVLLMMGIVIFGGIVGAKLFQKLKIPQVIGYIVIGLIIGEAGFGIISKSDIDVLNPLNYFALGIIGFMIGGELKLDLFKRYGKQFSAILIAEGIAAFVLVGGVSTLITYYFLQDIKMAVAVGVVLGAISSATDPASTVQVLWEYKTRGILTTAATAVVALDDALALTLYGIGTSVAGILTGDGDVSVVGALLKAFFELGGAVVLGVLGGFVLNWIIRNSEDQDSILVFALGAVLLTIGISIALELDVILASMSLGLTLTNIAPRRSVNTFELVKKVAPPIYILFFVFVGAGIKFESLSVLSWCLVIAYVLGRSIGKMSGSWYGAKLSGAGASVRKYLGMCLFAQGGVAVGLSILASQKFADQPKLAEMIIVIIATTTLIVQLLGPACVKVAVKGAGEVGMDVTEEDLIKTYKVCDVMEERPMTIRVDSPLKQILATFSQSESLYYPVIDNNMRVHGVITIDGIKETFAHQETASWLLACDMMQPLMDKIDSVMPLSEAFKRMKEFNLEYMCVASSENDELQGIIDFRLVKRKLSAEVIKRRELVDEAADVIA